MRTVFPAFVSATSFPIQNFKKTFLSFFALNTVHPPPLPSLFKPSVCTRKTKRGNKKKEMYKKDSLPPCGFCFNFFLAVFLSSKNKSKKPLPLATPFCELRKNFGRAVFFSKNNCVKHVSLAASQGRSRKSLSCTQKTLKHVHYHTNGLRPFLKKVSSFTKIVSGK